MQPDVPPNFLRVVDAIGRDKQLQIIFIFAEAFERVGNTGAREALEDHLPVCFEPRILA